MNPNNLKTFDEYTEYFTKYPLAWYDRQFLENFIQEYKNKINDIVALFELVGTTPQVAQDLSELLGNDKHNAYNMIYNTMYYLDTLKDEHCGVCGVGLEKNSIAGGGFYPPDCPLCYKMLCKDCAKPTSDGDSYCEVCFTEVDLVQSDDDNDEDEDEEFH